MFLSYFEVTFSQFLVFSLYTTLPLERRDAQFVDLVVVVVVGGGVVVVVVVVDVVGQFTFVVTGADFILIIILHLNYNISTDNLKT